MTRAISIVLIVALGLLAGWALQRPVVRRREVRAAYRRIGAQEALISEIRRTAVQSRDIDPSAALIVLLIDSHEQREHA